MSAAPPDVGRTARKRTAIVEAARAQFLAHGFAGTTMDQVAAAAQVSKQTVYKQFTDKAGLFTAVFEAAIAEAEAVGQERLDRLVEVDDLEGLEEELFLFARDHLATVLQPHLIQLRRMVIAESGRFPVLAERWHEAAPIRGHVLLGEAIEQLHERGLLHAPSPLTAAEHLNYLILAAPMERAMFTGSGAPVGTRARHAAEEAVRVFLAAYAAPPA
jgi:TetR/AcrR family transcriptional regulator, mexJK operon transcriptional repressor